jgi:hypothetical protein
MIIQWRKQHLKGFKLSLLKEKSSRQSKNYNKPLRLMFIGTITNDYIDR